LAVRKIWANRVYEVLSRGFCRFFRENAFFWGLREKMTRALQCSLMVKVAKCHISDVGLRRKADVAVTRSSMAVTKGKSHALFVTL
jgi:hypothetical protein